MIKGMLEVREMILKTYQKTRIVINPLVKFILSLIVFSYINNNIGFDPRFSKTIIELGLSAICAFTPGGVLVFFAMLLTLLHILSVNIFMAILLFMLFAVLYGLLLRFSPKEVAVAVAIPVLAKYNLHYCVPILMGSISTPVSILPTTAGVIVYSIMGVVKEASERKVNLDIDDVIQLYTDVFDAILDNKAMIVMAAVFAAVIAFVWVIREFSLDYAFEISIGAGVVVNILGFLIADLKYDTTVKIGTLIFMSLISGIIAMLCDYMKRILDYTAIEKVQFEDDDYYYYVKAVPKVNMSLREIDIKHFNRNYDDDEDDEDEDYDEDEEDYEENEEEYDSSADYDKGYSEDDDSASYAAAFDDDEEDEIEDKIKKYLTRKEKKEIRKEKKKRKQAELEEDEELLLENPDSSDEDDEDASHYLPDYGREKKPAASVNRVMLNDEGDYEEDMTLDDED